MKTIQITVTGKVQGVFFRAYTEKKAKELGLTGFVRNQADGSVFIEASGNDQALQELVTWCHTGSPLSSVKTVEEHEIESASNYSDFHIKR